MNILIRQFPLYRFLWYCEKSGLEKKVLDCGAGGTLPPLALFKQYGYETHGIEISEEQISQAQEFCKENGLEIEIIQGDMRQLPYEDRSFSFVFSYNTIFHLTKKDMKVAINEIKRVLKKDGLFYVNFLTTEDGLYGEGEEQEKGEFVQIMGEKRVLHTCLEDDELKDFLEGFELIYFDKKIERRPEQWSDYTAGFYDCILRKK